MADKNLLSYRTEEFIALASNDLTPDELVVLTDHAASGGQTLTPEAAARFFELYLNGSDCKEIQRLNRAFPLGMILDAKVRFKWTEKRDSYSVELQSRILDKVRKAQLETTELITDLLVATKKRYGDKLKKYIQTGNDQDLDNVLNIDSLKELLKVSEGLLKITGQDRQTKSVHETKNTQNVNLTLSGAPVEGAEALDPEDAAKILEIFSNAKKKKLGEPKG
jgi:hypothetical protein